jgi:hypothetical protein
MAGAFSFEDVVAACLYVLCIWVAGKLFGMTGGTPLVVCYARKRACINVHTKLRSDGRPGLRARL